MGPPSTALDAISCPYMEWFECELEADKSRGRDKVGLSEWQARLTRGPKCTDMSPAEEWFLSLCMRVAAQVIDSWCLPLPLGGGAAVAQLVTFALSCIFFGPPEDCSPWGEYFFLAAVNYLSRL